MSKFRIRYKHIIDDYTMKYASVMQNNPSIRLGQMVAISESCDDREYNDFKRYLESHGFGIGEFVRYHKKKQLNVYYICALHDIGQQKLKF